ncbi:MAG TPA: pyridoxamine 5'-phosphate oxidase family protein [Rhodopila sp.]|nr:pyridoxamine 5'-phosphate oxidase family protein [Rhodopila sp.]
MLSTIEAVPASPWHAGELILQRHVGAAEKMDDLGRRWVRDHLTDQQREFYPMLPFVVLGAVDPAGDAWATLRAGEPGFLSAPDSAHLHLALGREPSDPADAGMEDGDSVALLGIQLSTRRRNRMNGTIRRGEGGGFTLAVRQAYGNCPQYIQLRDFRFVADPTARADGTMVAMEHLDEAARATISRADTLFVASYVTAEDGTHRVDVSHRGGKSGFVRVDADGTLTIPDFAGNQFFNTLGNFLVNPRAGLVFVDFEQGALLQLTGTAEVVLDSPDIAAFAGAQRLWRFHPRRVVRRERALPLRWQPTGEFWSPHLEETGSWAPPAWRAFRVTRIVEESSVIRSLTLAPADGTAVVPHQAGQHLPIRVRLPGSEKPEQRSYTLSVAPSDASYRISVKREGAVSHHLHGLRVGDVIEARGPAGGFTIDAAEARPAVMLAGGVGITPLLAMLRHLVHEGRQTGRIRPTWLLQAARSGQERAFDAELQALVDKAGGAVRLVRFVGGAEGAGHDRVGRIDMAALTEILPFNDYDFYLCGPPAFMQSLYDGLRGLNVADARIHAEAFGPAALRRRADDGDAAPATAPSVQPVEVTFTRAGRTATWTPSSGSLLELAEASGLQPEFSCRNGSCGTCRTRILDGAVAYSNPPTALVGPDEALICCAMPAAGAALRVEV